MHESFQLILVHCNTRLCNIQDYVIKKTGQHRVCISLTLRVHLENMQIVNLTHLHELRVHGSITSCQNVDIRRHRKGRRV